MDRLNMRDLKTFKNLILENKEISEEQISATLERAERTVNLHRTASYSLLAVTYFRLGKFFN